MIYTELTKKAMKICFEVHKDQVDKSGMPYVFHPFHLAEQMHDEYNTAAALLHDTVKDTSVTFEYLEEQGIPKEVIKALKLLIYDESVPYWEYKKILKTIKNNKIAKAVKLAELRHNSDLTQLDKINYDVRAIDRDRAGVDILKEIDFWYDNKYDISGYRPKNKFSIKVEEHKNYYEVICDNRINSGYRIYSFKMYNDYINKVSIHEFADLIEAISPIPDIVDKNEILQDEEMIRLFGAKRVNCEKSPDEKKIYELSNMFLSKIEKHFADDETFQKFKCMESKCIYVAMKYVHHNREEWNKIWRKTGYHDGELIYDSMYSFDSSIDIWIIGLCILHICNLFEDAGEVVEEHEHNFSTSFILLSEKQTVSDDLLSMMEMLKPIKDIQAFKCIEDNPEIWFGCRCKYCDLSNKTEYGLYINTNQYHAFDCNDYYDYTFITIKPVAGYPDIFTM